MLYLGFARQLQGQSHPHSLLAASLNAPWVHSTKESGYPPKTGRGDYSLSLDPVGNRYVCKG